MTAHDHLDPLVLARKLTGDRQAVALLAEHLAEHLRPPLTYTCKTLAAEVECSPEAIGRAIRTGELPASRRAGKWLILAEDAAKWAATGDRPRVRARRDLPERTPARPRETPGSLALLKGAGKAA